MIADNSGNSYAHELHALGSGTSANWTMSDTGSNHYTKVTTINSSTSTTSYNYGYNTGSNGTYDLAW